MDEAPPQRVRVVLAGGIRPPRPDAAGREIEEQSEIGEVCHRPDPHPLALALRLSLLGAALFGIQPLLFALVPGINHVRIAGVPLPWLMLGVFAYPAVFGIAWAYVRAAERNEKHFAELVSRE